MGLNSTCYVTLSLQDNESYSGALFSLKLKLQIQSGGSKGPSQSLSSGSEIEISLRIKIADILNNFAQPLLILGKFTLVDILSDEIA